MRLIFLILFSMLCTTNSALAHKLIIEWKFTNNPSKLTIIVGYDGDEPAESATVKLQDSSGHEIARGQTDNKGVCQFACPKPGDYQIIADDGAGHHTTVDFNVVADVIVSESEQKRPVWPKFLLIAGLLAIWLVGIRIRSTRRQKSLSESTTAS